MNNLLVDRQGKVVEKGQTVYIVFGDINGTTYGKVVHVDSTSIEIDNGVWSPVSAIKLIEILERVAA